MRPRHRLPDQEGSTVNALRTLTITASAAALCLGGVAVSTPASAANNDTSVVTCQGKTVVKPKQIVVTCADAGVTVMSIKWTSWTMNGAKGVGMLAWNTCLPQTCVDGIVQKYKVKVTLGGVASGPNVSVFSQMTLAFPKGGPAAAETSTYTLDRPIS
jgi:hypothetical protein